MLSTHELISVKREQYPFPSFDGIPPSAQDAIFVPGIGADSVQYYFLVDFRSRLITCWTVELKNAKQALIERLAGTGAEAIPWNQGTLAKFIEVALYAHSAEYYGEWIFVSFIRANLILALHRTSDAFEIISDPHVDPDTVFSSTNEIRDGRIHFARWDIKETFKREHDRSRSAMLEIGHYDLSSRTFRALDTISGPGDIHYTGVSADGKTYVLVEMSQDPVAASPRDFEFETLAAEDKKAILERGIHQSELITYNVARREVHRRYVAGGPAHIEWDPDNANLYYLSSHNLVTNNDSLYCFGNSRFDKLQLLNGESILLSSYEAKDLLRSPSHKILKLGGLSLLIVPVFPNQVHIVNLDTMGISKKIHLARRPSASPDLSQGPVRYPRSVEDKTPYTIHTIDGTSCLYLSSVWNVSVFDFAEERKLGTIAYNIDKPVALMGHAAKFPSSEAVA